MSGVIIDGAMLDALCAEAAARPRRRLNRNFHASDEAAAHRLLNAVEPDSYVAPHRHLDPAKDETMVVLRGRLGVVLFDERGAAVESAVLCAGGPRFGIDIAHGTYHTIFALEPGTVVFEAKAGPFVALRPEERATWAPAEGDAGAAAYLERLKRGLA